MLKVGDFARLANVTVKTLHHYAELGLLRPVRIDRHTGYRYYQLEQLPRLNRILALKEMGFSLAEAGALLNTHPDAAALRRMFDQKQAELEERLRLEQERLKRVAERLRLIEVEGRLPEYEVSLKSVPAQSAIVQRLPQVEGGEFERAASQARAEISAWARSVGLADDGQWLTLYRPLPGRDQDLEVEIGLGAPGRKRLPKAARPAHIRLVELPAVAQMACVLHPPGGGAAQEARRALFTWAERSGRLPGSPWRELLLHDPAAAPSTGRLLELQIPVETYQELQKKYYANPYRKEDEMEPKFVTLPAFDVVGVRYYGKNEHQEISALWGEFNQRCMAIQHLAPNSPAYGICLSVPEATNGEFEYVASFAVEKVADLPEGMVSRHIPEHTYAVFTHVGALDKLGDTYHYIYQVWFPQSGHKPVGDIDFELYDEDFKDFAPDSRFYIYVPVK